MAWGSRGVAPNDWWGFRSYLVYVVNNVTHLANTTASRIHTLERSNCQLCVLACALMRRHKGIGHFLILVNH
jgi:hypothetical protein